MQTKTTQWKNEKIFETIIGEIKKDTIPRLCYTEEFFKTPKNKKEMKELTIELIDEMEKMGLNVSLHIFDIDAIRSEIIFSDKEGEKSLILNRRCNIFLIETVFRRKRNV